MEEVQARRADRCDEDLTAASAPQSADRGPAGRLPQAPCRRRRRTRRARKTPSPATSCGSRPGRTSATRLQKQAERRRRPAGYPRFQRSACCRSWSATMRAFPRPSALSCRTPAAGQPARRPRPGVQAHPRAKTSYTTAIETALGAAMQNIVVSSEEDGKAAIQMLKRRDGGRATFLPLTTIRPADAAGYRPASASRASSPSPPGSLPATRSTAPSWKTPLGRTVICDTLDHAVPMARA